MSILFKAFSVAFIFGAAQMVYNTATIDDQPKAPEAGTATRLANGNLQLVTSSYSQNGTLGYLNSGIVKIVNPQTSSSCDYRVERHSRIMMPTLYKGDFSKVVETGNIVGCTVLTPTQISCFNNVSNGTKAVTNFDNSNSYFGGKVTTHRAVSKDLRSLCVA